MLRRRVTLSRSLLMVCLILLAAATLHQGTFFVVYHLVLGCVILCVAYAKVPVLQRYNRLGDYSYGVYI